MENEEKNQEVALEEKNDTEETSEGTTEKVETKEEDYRAKLNIQNRFLEKEGYKFVEGKWLKPKSEIKPDITEIPKEALSLKDIRALNSVHDDDVDFITNWAKSNNVEIAEAVKNADVQLILKGHEENRKVADAANTGVSRRSSAKLADDVLLSNAQKGIMPESDDDLNRLLDLRKGITRK